MNDKKHKGNRKKSVCTSNKIKNKLTEASSKLVALRISNDCQCQSAQNTLTVAAEHNRTF